MIGQDYFDLRSRLGTALFSLSSLVPEASTDPDHAVILGNLVNSLKDPFVFVVVGEVNVGKSTLLNALFGAEFSRTGVMPTTDKICFFKYGAQHRTASVTRTLEEIYVPADFLKDFHVVDTPGTNSIEGEHQEITERFVPMADLVIFVFSAMNPWGASAWQFLEKVHRHWMRHVIFVLQQADLRTREEITAIIDYMGRLSHQRFGRVFPIFAVSGKKAFLAKTAGLDRDRLLAESGFNLLEQHIARSMAASTQRVAKLANALRIAWEILRDMQRLSGARNSGRDEKARVLQSIDSELAAQQERTLAKFLPVIEACEADLEHASNELLGQIHQRFNPRHSLSCIWREKCRVAGLEEQLLAKVKPSITQRWEQAAAIIEDDVGRFADWLGMEVSEGLKVQLRDDLRPDTSYWTAQRQHFGDSAREMMTALVSRLRLEPDLAGGLIKSRRLALAQALLLTASLAASIVFAAQNSWPAAGLCAGIGLLGTLLLWAKSSKMLRRLCLDTSDKLTLARPELRRLLGDQVRGDVRGLYASFERILQPTRERLLEQQTRHALLNEQLQSLSQTLGGIDGELRGFANAAGS